MKTRIPYVFALIILVVSISGWFLLHRWRPVHHVPQPSITHHTKPAAEPSHAPVQNTPTCHPVTAKAEAKGALRDPSPGSNLPSSILSEKLNEELREKPSYDQPGEAVEYYRLKRLPPGETEIPVEKYLEAKAQMDAMPQYSSAQNRYLPSRNEMKANRSEAAVEALGTWTPLGPGNVGGRTRALLIHPTTPNVMYAAGVAGGVWKTTNAGALWQPMTDLMANIAVSCLAFDPSNPNVIYAGTGEGFFNTSAVRGAGIFKTADGGNTWQQLTATGTSDFYYVNDIVVSRLNPLQMYAGTRTGVWRSLDGGATWSKVLNYTDGCLDLVMRTDQTTDYVFAACGSFGGGEIFRNTDAGGTGTWTSVHKEAGMGRTSLALAPSNQSVVYALSASTLSGTFRDGLYAVFRSINNGDAGTWTAQVRNNNPLKLNTILLTNPLISFRSECGLGANAFANQGWYDNVIAVDPLDANRVWVGGIDLFRSDDGGQNWGIASYWWPEPSVPQYAHADQHVIAFHPQYNGTTNKQMFVGNDGGIFRTDDARAFVVAGVAAPCNPSASGVRWTSLNNNYGVTQFYHGAVFPDGKSYFGGTQDNGTLLGTDASGTNGWREIWGGDGGYVAIDPTDPNVLYASTPGGRFRKSTNGGETFGSAVLGITDTRPLFIAPLAIDPSNPSQLWTAGEKLWRSENGAASWIEAGNLGQQQASSLAVSPQDSNYLLVGTTSGYAYLSRTASLSTSSSSYPPPRSGFVSGVAFDPTNKEVFYAVYSTFGGSHVYRLTNLGQTWAALDGQGAGRLPDIPVNCIAIDPNNSSRLFVGTDLGIFASTDGGTTWAVENTGFANVAVESLVFNTVNGVTSLYAFTHGRGVWRVALGNNSCSYALSGTTQRVFDSGGTGSVNVTASPGCAWQASSNAFWLTINAGASGMGNGAVQFTFAPNEFNEERTGTLTIAGKSHMIVQSALSDRTPPTITIQSPTTARTYQTGVNVIVLSGLATDDRGIEIPLQITTDRGIKTGSIEAGNSKSIKWNSYPVGLKIGINNITVAGADRKGNKASAMLQVIYMPAYVSEIIAGQSNPGFGGDGGPAKLASLYRPFGLGTDKNGNIYIADTGNHRIRKISPDGIINTIAGNGTPGFSGDGGPALQAQLSNPQQMTVDEDGNVYVIDNRRIRRVGTNGIINTVAGGGLDGVGNGGLATKAGFGYVSGVAINKAGDLYIIDDNRIRKVTTATGIIDAYAGGGTFGHGGDGGPVKDALFTVIRGIAFDPQGNLYITENARIRKVDAQGIIRTVAGNGTFVTYVDNVPATTTAATPNGPIVADSAGNIYFTEERNEGPHIRRVDTQGIITSIASGLVGTAAITVDRVGNVFSASGVVIKTAPFSLDKTAPQIAITLPTTSANYVTTNATLNLSGTALDNGKVTEIGWQHDRGGSGFLAGAGNWSVENIALLPGPNLLTVTAWDEHGNDSSARLLVTYTIPNTLTSVAGTRTAGFNLESGSGPASQLYAPETVALDAAGNLYIADKGNHRIRKVTRSGLISTVAGSGQLGSSGDGGLAINAAMNQPYWVAVDASGNLYISDTNNHRIRKVNASGIITTIAGTGLEGFGGDGGAATQAQLNTPVGITLDKSGNLLIADAANHRIRKLNLSTGIITTMAGNGYGFGGDGGQAAQAQLNFPTSVVLDHAGNFYIADTSNHQVRKVTAAGIISRFAGTGSSGFSGDGGQANLAQFTAPGGMTVDAAGNLYVTDQGNHRVRKIAPDGIITTIAGNGTTTSPTSDEGGVATTATLNAPAGVAVDAVGNLFIADTDNHRVVMVAAYKSAATVSAASYASTQPVAAESIVSVFGSNLATRDQAVTKLPLPTELEGTSVKVRDSLGIERLASLFYVGKLQVNYQIPAGTAAGFATVSITNGNGEIFTSAVNITAVTPGLFTANQNGTGAAAASILYFRNGTPRYESSFACDAQGQNCTARQIDLNAGDEVFLELYGTGIRNNSGLSNVTVTVGGEAVPVLYANKQPDFIGLDQVNIRIPKSFAGRGEVEVVLTVDGKAANPVKINLR
ncbi:MAG TPA: BACON domain-containing carbohydrate-binding protein [Blastocatellia bacterium]|nr:BACON domain-containing carbohydrate-binding protein [Blastocatellia bacterium]